MSLWSAYNGYVLRKELIYYFVVDGIMKCQVQYCNNDATYNKTELHEIESECVIIVKTETEICKDHADLIKQCKSSRIEIDNL